VEKWVLVEIGIAVSKRGKRGERMFKKRNYWLLVSGAKEAEECLEKALEREKLAVI